MAQTTDYESWENAQLEFTTDATVPITWVDISGSTNSCDAAGGDIPVGTVYTHQSDTPLVGYGKKALRTWVVNAIYTETEAEAFLTVEDAYHDRAPCWLRVTPRGHTAGNKRYTTTEGRVTALKLPSGKAEDSAPVMCTFTVTAPDYEMDEVPTA